MNVSMRNQLLIGTALVVLMAITRGSHFATVNLPSASWSVFFLAGVLLKPRWVFPALFIEASLLDFSAIQWAGMSDWCMSPAYWLLVPAYGSMWLGGRIYARLHQEKLSSVLVLAATVIASATVCYLFSGGGFLFFSGRYPDPTLSMLVERFSVYLPRYLVSVAWYVGVAALLFTAIRLGGQIQQKDQVQP